MLDLGLILIFIISFFIGTKIGAFKAIYAIVSFFASFTLGRFITPLLMPLLLKTKMYDSLFIYCKDMLGFEEKVNEMSRNAQAKLISELPFGGNVVEKILENNNTSIYDRLGVDKFADYVAGMLSSIILFIGTSIVVFFAIYIIIIILGFSLDLFSKFPIVSQLNRFLGGILGVINSAFIIWLIAILIEIFMMNTFAIKFHEIVDNSLLGEFFFSHNVFILWLKNFFTF